MIQLNGFYINVCQKEPLIGETSNGGKIKLHSQF